MNKYLTQNYSIAKLIKFSKCRLVDDVLHREEGG